LPGLPGLPVSDLGVSREQQHVSLSNIAEFDREDEARIVGVALQRQRQFRRRAEPIAVDPPPVVTPGVVAPGIVFSEEIVDPPPVLPRDGMVVEQPRSAR